MAEEVKERKLSKKEIRDELWSRGILRFKCHSIQKEMYDLFYAAEPRSQFVWLLARQSGKSVLLSILALEQALREPNSIVKFATDTKIHAESVLQPIFTMLLEDCPQHLRPQYNQVKFTYMFANGSQIQLAGTDNKHYEKLRGQKAQLVLVDEAGFCNDLESVIKSVLIPTTTHTKGKLVMASTPPEQTDHDFIHFIETADLNGRLTKKTIDQNPLLTPEDVAAIAESMGGRMNERFRREYLCELIRDSGTTVIPEFTDELASEIVKEWPVPPYYDSYVSMDLGGKDLTVVLFGYYDFRADKIIIQDELVMDFTQKDQNIKTLTDGIMQKEKELWFNVYTNELKVPNLRVSDINYIVTQQIQKDSGYKLNFIAARKDDKAAALNNIRDYLQSQKIIIDPKCKTLIRHLKNVRWKSSNDKSKFARSPDDGHYDAVDALIYFVRHTYFGKNPYPKGYELNLRRDDVFSMPSSSTRTPRNNSDNNGKHLEVYNRIFGRKK